MGLLQMNRIAGLLLVLVVVAGLGAACTTTPPTGTPSANLTLPAVIDLSEAERRNTVVWELSSGRVETPRQWNPLLRDARLDKGFHQTLIEPLFVLNYESGVIEPWLGKQMTPNVSQDIWTLVLREGVTWSDGEPFTADDVVFSIELLQAYPQLELDFFAGLTDWIDHVEQGDDYTVTFHLREPNPRFQLDFFSVKVWGSFPILPEHIWHDKNPLTFSNYDPEQGWPVFTGPYRLESIGEQSFTYVRREDWWGAETGFRSLPAPERLIWVFVPSEEHKVAWTADNALDVMGDISRDGLLELRSRNPNVSSWFDGLPYAWLDPCSRTLSLNHLQAPWGNKDMRWAVNFALNRDEIVAEAYAGTTLPSRHFFPAYPPLERYVDLLEAAGLYDEYPLLLHSPQRARQLIEANGWTMGSTGFFEQAGEQLTLTIYVHENSSEMQRMGNIMVEQLAVVGINARMQPIPNDTWVERKTNGTFEAMIDWDSCGSINEPWASLDRYHARWARPMGEPVSNYNNQVRWSNADYSAIVDEMAPLPLGDPEVDTLFVQAMDIWFEELPFIPVTQSKQLISFNNHYWQGWPSAQHNYVHPPGWWQSAHLIIHNLEPVTAAES